MLSKRFYSFIDSKTGLRHYSWLCHDPDAATWVDCTDMDDAEFAAFVATHP